jgi:hypothetical protein
VNVPVSGIRVKLDPIPDKPYLKAYVDFKLGPLTVNRCKIVRLRTGQLTVRYPETPLLAPCPGCHSRVGQEHRFCHNCGLRQPVRTIRKTKDGTRRRFRAVAFPATRAEREQLDKPLLQAYLVETGVRPRLNVVTAAGA